MVGTYDYWLVLLSVVVAITASYVALDLASRVAAAHGHKAVWYWLGGGAISMGTGIWSMHFIGMLAFRLPIPVSYDVPITLASLMIAIAASGFALAWVSFGALGMHRLLGGSLLMGVAIISMHYTGMAAMRMEPPIQYQPIVFGLSALVAVGASVAALSCAFRLRMEAMTSAFWKKAGSAFVMGTAIYGMHHAGIAAAAFAPNSVCTVSPQNIDNVELACTLGGFTLLFLTATLLVSAYDAYLGEHSAENAKVLSQAHDALEARVAERTAELARANQSLLEQVADRERAEREIRASREQLRALASRLQSIREEGRTQTARNVHDELGQALTAAKIDLSLLEQDVKSRKRRLSRPRILREVRSARRTIDKAIASIGSIATRLRPVVLDQLGLAAAIDWQVQDFEKRTRLACKIVSSRDLPEPDKERSIVLFRILQEALTNVVRHAAATAVEIEFKEEGGNYVLQIQDDGIGISDSQRNGPSSLGLVGMRERALMFGGEVVIERGPRGGTLVTARISLGARSPAA